MTDVRAPGLNNATFITEHYNPVWIGGGSILDLVERLRPREEKSIVSKISQAKKDMAENKILIKYPLNDEQTRKAFDNLKECFKIVEEDGQEFAVQFQLGRLNPKPGGNSRGGNRNITATEDETAALLNLLNSDEE